MTRRTMGVVAMIAGFAFPLKAQSSAAACAPVGDSTMRQVAKTFGDMRVCMLALQGEYALDPAPRTWLKSADRVVFETQREGDFRRLSTTSTTFDWTVNGTPKPYDEKATAWRDAVIDLLATVAEADELRAKSSHLRGQVDSLPQMREQLNRRIAVTEQQAKDIQSTIQLIKSSDRSLQADIGVLERNIQQLQNQISREQRAQADLKDMAAQQRQEARIRQLNSELRRMEDRLRASDTQLRNLDPEHRIALLETQLKDLRPEHTIAMARLQLGNLEGLSVVQLQKELDALDVDNRLKALDAETEKYRVRLLSLLNP